MTAGLDSVIMAMSLSRFQFVGMATFFMPNIWWLAFSTFMLGYPLGRVMFKIVFNTAELSSWRQWAAVRTCWSLMRVPPQINNWLSVYRLILIWAIHWGDLTFTDVAHSNADALPIEVKQIQNCDILIRMKWISYLVGMLGHPGK